jgi:hypothetical protein
MASLSHENPPYWVVQGTETEQWLCLICTENRRTVFSVYAAICQSVGELTQHTTHKTSAAAGGIVKVSVR